MRADVARTSGHQDGHCESLPQVSRSADGPNLQNPLCLPCHWPAQAMLNGATQSSKESCGIQLLIVTVTPEL